MGLCYVGLLFGACFFFLGGGRVWTFRGCGLGVKGLSRGLGVEGLGPFGLGAVSGLEGLLLLVFLFFAGLSRASMGLGFRVSIKVCEGSCVELHLE